MKRETGCMRRICRCCAVIAAVLSAMAALAETHWWDSAVLSKTVTLAQDAQAPQSVACDREGRYLRVSTAGSDAAALYNLSSLVRYNATASSADTSLAAGLDFSGSVVRGVSYYAKEDNKVYVSSGGSETMLCDLSGVGAVLGVGVSLAESENPALSVLMGSGAVRVYSLASDGLSLAAAEPSATVDVASLIGSAPTAFAVSPDGFALFAVTSAGNSLYVVRSSVYGLVDCVAATSDLQFPWRSDVDQTTGHWVTGLGTVTVPDASEEYTAPQIWPWAYAGLYLYIGHSGELTSTFSNLTPGDAYRAEYHFAENWFQEAGKRVADFYINGELKYDNLDYFVIGGNKRQTAVALSYDATATAAGQMVFNLKVVTDVPIFSGFAVFGREKPTFSLVSAEFSSDGSTGTLSYNAKDALAYYVQSASSSSGPWTTLLVDQTAKTFNVAPGASSAVFYRVVASNGVGTVSSAVSCNKSDKYTVYALECGYDTNRHGRFAPHDHVVSASRVWQDKDARINEQTFSPNNEHSIPAEVAKMALYASSVDEALTYRFRNLRPDLTYDVRVFCQETAVSAEGGRVFDMKVNGDMAIEGIDPYKLGGDKFVLSEVIAQEVAPNAQGIMEVAFHQRNNCVDITAIEIVENNSTCVPLVPVVHGAYERANGVHVAIGSGTGNLAYEVRRRPSAGGDYVTLATNIADNAWYDVDGSADYVYSVRATDDAGSSSDWSDDVAVTSFGAGPTSFIGLSPRSAQAYTGANGTYVSYVLYNLYGVGVAEGAQTYRHDIVLDPGPSEIYSFILYPRTIDLAFTNLYPGASYKVRLQALESWFSERGKRVTSGVFANNAQVHDGFDAYCEVGKGVFPVEAVVKATPDGKINLFTTQVTDNLDFVTAEVFLLESGGEVGVARAVRTAGADGSSWTQSYVSTFDLSGLPSGLPATGNEFIWDAMLSVPADGAYTFDVEQGGDYALWIDDGFPLEAHGGNAASATFTLSVGEHHVRARYLQGSGAASVALKWTGPNVARQSLAASALTKSRTTDLSYDDWQNAEIGTAHMGDLYKVGQTAQDGSEIWRMTACNKGFWGGNDTSHFVYRAVRSPRFEAKVRLRRVVNPNPGGNASTFGLTLRTGLEPFVGDYVRQVITGVTNPGMGTNIHIGSQGADFTVESPWITNDVVWEKRLPVWQRVRKWRGDDGSDLAEFSYTLDPEGDTDWVVCCTNELTSTRPIYVGLEASSFNAERIVAFEFDNLELKERPYGFSVLVR